jgi:hypothetical protein
MTGFFGLQRGTSHTHSDTHYAGRILLPIRHSVNRSRNRRFALKGEGAQRYLAKMVSDQCAVTTALARGSDGAGWPGPKGFLAPFRGRRYPPAASAWHAPRRPWITATTA